MKFGTVSQFNRQNHVDHQNFEFLNIQDDRRPPPSKSKNRAVSVTVWPISAKLGMITQLDHLRPIDH